MKKAPVASPPPRREDAQPITKVTYSRPVSQISWDNHKPQMQQQTSPAVQAPQNPQNPTTTVRRVVQRSPAPPLLAPSPGSAPKAGSSYHHPSPHYMSSQTVVQPQRMEQQHAGGTGQQFMGGVPQQGVMGVMYASGPAAINSPMQNQGYAQQRAAQPQFVETPLAYQPPKQLFQSPMAPEHLRRLSPPPQKQPSPQRLMTPPANFATPESAIVRDMRIAASSARTQGSGAGSAIKDRSLFSSGDLTASQRRPGRPGEYEETLRKDRLARLLQTFKDFEADIVRTTTNMTRSSDSFNPFVPPVADPAQPGPRFGPTDSPIPPPVPNRSPTISPSTISVVSAMRGDEMRGRSPESDRLGALISAYDRIKEDPSKWKNEVSEKPSPNEGLKKDLAHLKRANDALFEKLDNVNSREGLEGVTSHSRSPQMYIEKEDSIKIPEEPAARPEQAARAILSYMTPVAGVNAAKVVGDILKQMSLTSVSVPAAQAPETGGESEEF